MMQSWCIGNGQLAQLKLNDKTYALDCMHDEQALLIGGGGTKEGEILGENQWFVRRLTPLECERLQGFPDYWCHIGDWVDKNGKLHKDADAPKYKELGNSIALPYWYELIKNISAEYTDRKPTMTSLFSGIGGFDLCWLWVNGEGTVPNVAEIEPHPCAVLEKHFGEDGDWAEYPKPAWFRFTQ